MKNNTNVKKQDVKKKDKKAWVKYLIFALVILAAILVVVNRERIFAPFKDAGLNVGEGGFPVNLPGSTEYHLGGLGDGFFLLTDTYIYTYNSEGAQIAGIQHGFQNPAGSSKSSRALVYDKNGSAFKLYSRTSEVYSNSVEDSIVFAQVGNDERAAVITTSTRYSNYLYVYSSEGKQIFRWASPDEKIMGVCFDDKDLNIYVSVVGEKGGELKAYVVKFALQGDGAEAWKTQIGNNITYSLEYCSDGIYAVSGTGAFLLDENSGEIKAQNSYSHRIHGIPSCDGMRAVIFHDSASNGEIAVTYNSSLEAISSVSIDALTDYDISGDRLYILGKNTLGVYDASLNRINSYELDDTYSKVKVVDGKAYLLGYNTVWQVVL